MMARHVPIYLMKDNGAKRPILPPERRLAATNGRQYLSFFWLFNYK